jgi:hypothetical protein
MLDLLGQYVEVIANDITYTGKLVEVGEDEVYIEADSGWIVIPTDRVAVIRKKDTE